MKTIVKAIFSSTLSLSLAAVPAAVATAGALFSLAASMVGAAEISQPGDLLYPLRRPALELQLTLTTDPETRAQLEDLLAFAPVPENQPGGNADSAPAATPAVSGGNNPLPVPTLGNAAAPPPTVSVPPTQPAAAGVAISTPAAVGSPAIAPSPTEDNGHDAGSVGDDHGGDQNANSDQSSSAGSDSSQSGSGGEIGNDHSGGGSDDGGSSDEGGGSDDGKGADDSSNDD